MDEAAAQTVLADLTSTDPQLQLLSSDAISEITTHSYAVEPVDGQSNTWTVKVVAADNSTDDLVVSIKDTVKDQSGNALGTTSATFTLAVDTVNPVAPTLDILDAAVSTADYGAPVLTVEAEDQAQVTLELKGSNYVAVAAEVATWEQMPFVVGEPVDGYYDAADVTAAASEAGVVDGEPVDGYYEAADVTAAASEAGVVDGEPVDGYYEAADVTDCGVE